MEPRLRPAAVVYSILLLLLLLLLSTKSGAVTFEATNAVPNTTGGERFNKDIGLDYAKQVLSDASVLIWNTFNQPSPADRKPVDTVTLVVEDEDWGMVAFTSGSQIHLSAQYVGGYSGDVKSEVTGLLYHETTHVWQWFGGNGEGNQALFEGIADFIRLKAGWYAAAWVRRQPLERWDQGYEVTARFLDYCNSLTPGFIALLNDKMKDDYTDDFFFQITGKTVQQLWQGFVQTYNGTGPDGTMPRHNSSIPSGHEGSVSGGTTSRHNNSIPTANVPRENGTDSTSRHTSTKHLILSIAIPVGIITLCLISAVIICALRGTSRPRQKTLVPCTTYSEDIEEIQALLLDPVSTRAATDNFSEVNKLGEGGFGQVYKGLLPGGLEVAVKRLAKESRQGMRELKNELVLVAKLQHRNLVKLLGACLHEEEKLLVYEYIPNKSLDAFIFDEEKRKKLGWEMRYKIICGIARGMVYLHDESRVKVIHRDLKPSNILLEKDMNPKICDFGLARIFERDNTKDVTRRVAGTYGYMAPEYAVLGHISTKSDVFSFGVIVLEIVTGRRNTTSSEGMMAEHLLSYVWENWTSRTVTDIVDPYLNQNCAENEVLKCIHIGLLCVQENPSDRPSMSDVILMLVGRSTTLPAPSRPAFLFSLEDANHVHPGGANELPERSNKCKSSFNKVTITELEPR